MTILPGTWCNNLTPREYAGKNVQLTPQRCVRIRREAGDRVLEGDEDDPGRGRIGHAGLAAGRYPSGAIPGRGRKG